MTKTVIKFGTDGWRAIMAEDFTFENVRVCAQSVANYLRDTGTSEGGLVIGYDTRFLSDAFAAAVAEVVAGNGIKCYLCAAAAPTPVVSYSILVEKAAGAGIITSSHNAAEWNGFKYKPEYAGSASPQVVAELEKRIDDIQATGAIRRIDLEEGARKGLVEKIDPSAAYFEHIGELIDLPTLKNAGLKVVHDAMFGAGIGYFSRLLSGGKTQVAEIHSERNPLFPGLARPEPIGINLSDLKAAVVDSGAAIGLATDGDSDRVGAIDEKGDYIDQLRVFGLLALYLLDVRGWRGPIIKTLSTTSMIDKLGELYGVPVFETAVGFKYVGPKMIETNALIGGEESGGFGFRGHIPERDGLLAGLCLLDMMGRLGRSPSQLVDYLFSKVGPHYYDRVDVEYPAERRDEILQRVVNHPPTVIDGKPVVRVQTEDGFKYHLADGSWLLIRFSGTEPVLRIYTETSSPERVKRILEEGQRFAGV
ncbi:MAG: phosphoglucomutase/phosphomannomutase family protein [Chloroflexi bacterium]|nr:phosphoglucomutase/phosphomannomutase family protein [Chloroflexota bacterium]